MGLQILSSTKHFKPSRPQEAQTCPSFFFFSSFETQLKQTSYFNSQTLLYGPFRLKKRSVSKQSRVDQKLVYFLSTLFSFPPPSIQMDPQRFKACVCVCEMNVLNPTCTRKMLHTHYMDSVAEHCHLPPSPTFPIFTYGV